MKPSLLKKYQTKEIKRCLACDVLSGKVKVVGGVIFETKYWSIDHTAAPLGVGTLIIKLKRLCTNIGELTAKEATDLGRVIKKASNIINKLLQPDQIYVCMWAHASWVPGHIHFVVQPAWNKLKTKHKKTGPFLQTDMYIADKYPKSKDIIAFVRKAKKLLSK